MIETATGALAALKSTPPREIRVRSGFVYRADVPPREPSDRRAPNLADRPPATRIMSPTGSALRLYLLALYEAHLHASPGRRPGNRYPLIDHSGEGRGWVDLLAPRSSLTTGARTNVAMSRAEKKKRRIVSALKSLSHDEIQLVHLPNHGKAVDTYEQFRLMNERGPRGDADPVLYAVPNATEEHFTLPTSLFLNGWIHVLEDTELAFLMMLIHRKRTTQDYPVAVPSDIRFNHYGIGRDAYEAHRMLARFGLIQVEADPDRRSDGTIVDYEEQEWHLLHRFRIFTAGLDQPAVPTAIRGIQEELGQNVIFSLR